MKITNNMINKQLRFQGRIVNRFTKSPSEKKFKLMQKIIDKTMIYRKSNKINCRKINIKKKDGNDLKLCIYESLNKVSNAVGLLWFHGGGYAIGIPEMDVSYAEKFILAKNCVVISPNYTLSTSKPYPAALVDCYEALLWIKENAQNLGIRDDQIFVGGDSAGGGLAAAISLYARDKGEVNIAFQMPLYPMIDDRMNTNSAKDNNAPVWNSKCNEVAWKMYLGDFYGREEVPKYAAPSRETNYKNLPPTYTFIGDIEPFYDETITYINNLKSAGVKAEVDVYSGCFHGFDQICSKTELGKTAINKLLEEFKYASDNYFAVQPKNI